MIDVDFVKSCVSNPLIIIRFVQDTDLALVFCATTDEKEALNGLSLFGVRKSKGAHPFRLKSDIVSTIFQPRLKRKHDHEWSLHIEPLAESISIIKRPTHFLCLYPFPDRKVAGTVVDVVVEAQLTPLKMWFTVNCTFKAKKDAPLENLSKTIQCPENFTEALYNVFRVS